MQCIDELKLQHYMQGSLPADELVAVSEHLTSCAACRTRLRACSKYRVAAWTIGQASAAVSDCPEYEELSAFVDGTLSHEPKIAIEHHINLCELCWKDVETIQGIRSRASFAPQISVVPGQYAEKRRWAIFSWQRAVLAASAAALAVTIFLASPYIGGNPSDTTTVALNPQSKPTTVTGTTPDVKPTKDTTIKPEADDSVSSKTIVHKPKPAPKPVYVAVIKDGDIEVGKTNGSMKVKSNGRSIGMQLALLLEKKLKDGRVPASFMVAQRTDVLRGPVKHNYIEKLSPAPESLTASKPEFKWNEVEGALEYRVEVFKLDGTPVMCADTETTSYQPAENIPAGAYKWVVRARRGQFASWEWSKADMFRILSEKENSLIEQAKRDFPGSHIALGTVYEHLGLTDKAVDEFESLAKLNPGSTLAKRLLSGAKSHTPPAQ